MLFYVLEGLFYENPIKSVFTAVVFLELNTLFLEKKAMQVGLERFLKNVLKQCYEVNALKEEILNKARKQLCHMLSIASLTKLR